MKYLDDLYKTVDEKMAIENPLYKSDITLKIKCDELPYAVEIKGYTITELLPWISDNSEGRFSMGRGMKVVKLHNSLTEQMLKTALQTKSTMPINVYFENEEDAIQFKLRWG